LSAGIYHLPKTGRYQVWVSTDLERLQWVTAHRYKVGADRLLAIINVRKEELRHPISLRDFLRLLACESEGTPTPVSAEAERIILEHARIAAQRPRFEQSLDIFSVFLQKMRHMGTQHTHQGPPYPFASSLPWFASIQAALFARCAEVMSIFFVESTALKMCEAMLAIDGHVPEFPGQPLWIQPMAPLWFRGLLVRGVVVTPVSLRPLFDQDAFRRGVPEHEKERDWQQIAHLEGSWHIFLIVDPNYRQHRVPPREPYVGELQLISFARYCSTGTWELTLQAATACPAAQCLYEVVGAQSTVVPCEQCEEELANWTHWIKTMFWVLSGKFRKADDQAPFKTTLPALPADSEASTAKGNDQSNQPRSYQAQMIAYDASYFKPAVTPQGRQGTLKDRYLVLTAEEALAEGAIEIDLDGVLIRDFGPVSGYHRRKPGRQEKQYIAPKNSRAQYVSLRTWKAREERRAHRVTALEASEYINQL